MGETGADIRLLDLSPEILARIVSHVSDDFREMGPLLKSCRALRKAAQTATEKIIVSDDLDAAKARKEARMIMAFAPTLKRLFIFGEGDVAKHVLTMGWQFKSLRELQIGDTEYTGLVISITASTAATLRKLDLAFGEYDVEAFNFYLNLLCSVELHPECETDIEMDYGPGNHSELFGTEPGTDFSQLASLPSLVCIIVRCGSRIKGLTGLKALPKLEYVELCECAIKRSDLLGFTRQAPALEHLEVIDCLEFESGDSISGNLDELKSGWI